MVYESSDEKIAPGIRIRNPYSPYPLNSPFSLNPKHLHHLIPKLVDGFHSDVAGSRLVEGAGALCGQFSGHLPGGPHTIRRDLGRPGPTGGPAMHLFRLLDRLADGGEYLAFAAHDTGRVEQEFVAAIEWEFCEHVFRADGDDHAV